MPHASAIPAVVDQAQQMDRMYRYTRHVYDASRKFYLLGRDTLLQRMEIRPGDRVLEIGCGTARNLLQLARRHPQARLFGLDASQKMLDIAAAHAHRAAGTPRLTLRQCLAENLDAHVTFGLDEPFDVVFFSYSLSMIPTWPAALEAALANLRPGRTLYVVDFWDQRGLPRWFAALLQRWLALFHVHHRPELLQYLHAWQQQGRGTFTVAPIAGRYAWLGRFAKASPSAGDAALPSTLGTRA